MRFTSIWSAALVALAAGCASTPAAEPLAEPPEPTGVYADLHDAEGRWVARALFTESPGAGVVIVVSAWGLSPGAHGLHIHEMGDCAAPNFASCGAHFNPHGKKHGLKNAEGPHAGDLPNLVVGADGKAEATVVARALTLEPGTHSLLKDGGTALVIHEKEDDEMTDPTGNSGARIACGAIREK